MPLRRTVIFLSPILLIIFLASLTPTALAQTAQGSDPLEIDVSPAAPSPNGQATITLTSTTLDLGQATIAWSVNGNPATSGSGVRSFTFTMGPAGRSTTVTIEITPKKGSRVIRNLTFRPASVALLWEADTYTPPLYRGQAQMSGGAGVRILALANVLNDAGTPIPSSELTFKWEMNGDAYADRSGLGRDVLLLSGSQVRQREEVGVTVLRRDGSQAAQATVVIPVVQPLIRFYRIDPLRGTRYERNLSGEVALSEAETTIVAEPYFMGGKTRTQEQITYTWRLNGNEVVPEGKDRTVITLRQQQGVGGIAYLEFQADSNAYSKLLQSAGAALTLLLNSRGGSGGL